MKTTNDKHLTQTNRRAIARLIANNINEGKIGVISYFLTKTGEKTYTVKIVKVDRGMGFIGSEKRLSTYTCNIEL